MGVFPTALFYQTGLAWLHDPPPPSVRVQPHQSARTKDTDRQGFDQKSTVKPWVFVEKAWVGTAFPSVCDVIHPVWETDLKPSHPRLWSLKAKVEQKTTRLEDIFN